MKINKRLFLAIEKFIDSLTVELHFLKEQNFPENETDLFCRKCMHLQDVLRVKGPRINMGNLESTQVQRMPAQIVQENFIEFHNWLLATKYLLALSSEIRNGTARKTKKKLELEIPKLFKWKSEED